MDARIVELVARLTALVSDVQCHQAVTRRSLATFAYRPGGILHDLSISEMAKHDPRRKAERNGVQPTLTPFSDSTVKERRHTRAFSRATRARPELMSQTMPSDTRARGMPGAQCTRSLACAGGSKSAREYSQRRHRKTSGIPHAMVLRLIRDLPGDEFLLPPSPRGLHGISYPGWAECLREA